MIALLTVKPGLGMWAGLSAFFQNENFPEKSYKRDTSYKLDED